MILSHCLHQSLIQQFNWQFVYYTPLQLGLILQLLLAWQVTVDGPDSWYPVLQVYVAVTPNVIPVAALDPLGMVGGLPQETATDSNNYNEGHFKV